MFSDSILNKVRLYFRLHPDYWKLWQEGNFDYCYGCKHPQNKGSVYYAVGCCDKTYVLMVDRDLKELSFGDPRVHPNCRCAEWVKDV